MAGKRPTRRKRVLYAGIIAHADGDFGLDCTIHDLGEDGALIAVHGESEIPSNFYLINIRDRIAYDAKVIWNIGAYAGVTYEKVQRLIDIFDPSLNFLKRMWQARTTH